MKKEQLGAVVDNDYLEYETGLDDDERMIVNMGPQHPSTHGVLRLQIELEGEIIRRTKPIIGYLHTGMEKTAENLMFMQGGTNVTRMDYLAPLHNELCYSLAVEELLGIDIPPRAHAIRVLMTELNRIASHLVAIATNGMDIGAISMMLYGFRERETILAFFEKVTGLRMNHNYIRPGGVAADLSPGWRKDVTDILDSIPRRLQQYDDLLEKNPIWLERTKNVGVVTAEEALAYSLTGPILRATGVNWDLRKSQPYSGIEQYDFAVVTGQNGDVYDRYRIRMEEIEQSLSIVRQAMDTMPKGNYMTGDRKVAPPPRGRIDESMEALIHHFKLFTEGFRVPAGETYTAVESPRGELGCYLVSTGGSRPWRMHTRAPSFYNIQGLPTMMADSLVSDTVATIASLDPIMGDVDR
ncbi:MAG: NADH-quinone oxidoreductase subunit D [Acidimicrobiia bacterium]|nr:NADH-quinone oxidoreductase subunit D [Acidimicrobiia bacterium]